jgi:hypothetical protein
LLTSLSQTTLPAASEIQQPAGNQETFACHNMVVKVVAADDHLHLGMHMADQGGGPAGGNPHRKQPKVHQHTFATSSAHNPIC